MSAIASLLFQNVRLVAWRPVYWEPVAGTGERIMVGVVHAFDPEIAAVRVLRDEVLDALFGRASAGARGLIDEGLATYAAAANAAGVAHIGVSMLGLHAGDLRETAARSISELLQTAALLYSSLASLDKLDELEESDLPQAEDVNRRFSTEVRDVVGQQRPDLLPNFGRGGELVHGGQRVKFGYFSPRAVLHFTVLGAVRQGAGVRDARARLFELQRAVAMASIPHAALIAAVPRDDDPTLGPKQREQLRANRAEIEQEADAVNMRWYAVTSVPEAAERVLELAA
jgi:hypothetical protein